jgi:Zn-dependent protease with chaperone function
MKPALSAAAALVLSATLAAQTAIKPPKNRYKPEDDVKLGREAAAEVRKQYPVIENGQINDYLARLGRELVAQAPPELNRPEFEYSFTAVNLKDINAFALPGGPMFVNRGMVDAAASEGQVVGVMAHELSHVLLRHGTANATKAQNAQFGALAGAIAGAVIGGRVGTAVSQGSQFGLGTLLLRYSRDYEKQADLLGAQLMARAGYDPNDLARMFETIEKQAKSRGGPEWLSDHPNPGNRSQYIAAEARQLQVAPNASNGRDFPAVKQAFAGQPAPRSMGELAQRSGNGTASSGGSGSSTGAMASTGTPGQPVPPPSARTRTERGGSVFQVTVPDNWRTLSANSYIRYVPENAFGPMNGQNVLTHGVELGIARAASTDLLAATDTFIQGLMQGEQTVRRAGEARVVTLGGRRGLATPLVNRSPLGGDERLAVYTVQLADGNLFYVLTVVPERDEVAYAAAFESILRSIRLNDRRTS